MSVYKEQCQIFFESPAGQHFLTKISALVDSNHQKAEETPELARDYVQRAKGIKEVKALVTTLTISVKKSPYSSGASEQNTSQESAAPSTGLGTSL